MNLMITMKDTITSYGRSLRDYVLGRAVAVNKRVRYTLWASKKSHRCGCQ